MRHAQNDPAQRVGSFELIVADLDPNGHNSGVPSNQAETGYPATTTCVYMDATNKYIHIYIYMYIYIYIVAYVATLWFTTPKR